MAWDVCPASDLISQGYGCTNVTSEWIDASCPQPHRRHTGVDFGHSNGSWVINGSPIVATRSGRVVAVGANGEGNSGFSLYLGDQAVCLVTDARPARYLLYGHCERANVAVGQRVKPGDVIAYVGSKGHSTAPHLHLEVRTDGPYQLLGGSIDPMPFAQKESTGGRTMLDDATLVTLHHLIQFYCFGQVDPGGQADFVNTVKAGAGMNSIMDGWLASPQSQQWQAAVARLKAGQAASALQPFNARIVPTA
jgi:peptidase M23-like protein